MRRDKKYIYRILITDSKLHSNVKVKSRIKITRDFIHHEKMVSLYFLSFSSVFAWLLKCVDALSLLSRITLNKIHIYLCMAPSKGTNLLKRSLAFTSDFSLQRLPVRQKIRRRRFCFSFLPRCNRAFSPERGNIKDVSICFSQEESRGRCTQYFLFRVPDKKDAYFGVAPPQRRIKDGELLEIER